MFCLNETASENISYIDKESRHFLLSIFVLLPERDIEICILQRATEKKSYID